MSGLAWKKVPQETRLGHALRALEIEDEIHSRRRDQLARALDETVRSTGRKGAGILILGAYGQAKAFYEAITGKPYVPVK